MISWKHSFESLNEEYEITNKKKQALDNLLDAGKISQSTYDSFTSKIDEAIAEIGRQQRALLDKMNSKTEELELHIKTLETLLANFEIKHVADEIDEEVYQREVDLLSTGLEITRQELETAKDAISQLSSTIPVATIEAAVPQEVEQETTEDVEPPQPEISVVESEENPEEIVKPDLPEPPVEFAEGSEPDTLEEPQETSEEMEQSTEQEDPSTETMAEGEEIQE